MSANNPDITASDIITDVENRLGNPNIGASKMLPWVSYGYQKTYQTLIGAGQQVKEELFGNVVEFELTPGVAEYSIETNIPRFGGFIKVEVRYGATGNVYTRASRLPSLAYWRSQSNTSTAYQPKDQPMYYQVEDKIGFIPEPVLGEVVQDAMAKVWYIRRPYQITETDDVIDLPYRFLYPIVNYVQSRAIERENEDYEQAAIIERKFERELEQLVEFVENEYSESEMTNFVAVAGDSPLHGNPMRGGW